MLPLDHLVQVRQADGSTIEYVLLENQQDLRLVVLPRSLRDEAAAAQRDGYCAIVFLLATHLNVLDRHIGARLSSRDEHRALTRSTQMLVRRAGMLRTPLGEPGVEGGPSLATLFALEVALRRKLEWS